MFWQYIATGSPTSDRQSKKGGRSKQPKPQKKTRNKKNKKQKKHLQQGNAEAKAFEEEGDNDATVRETKKKKRRASPSNRLDSQRAQARRRQRRRGQKFPVQDKAVPVDSGVDPATGTPRDPHSPPVGQQTTSSSSVVLPAIAHLRRWERGQLEQQQQQQQQPEERDLLDFDEVRRSVLAAAATQRPYGYTVRNVSPKRQLSLEPLPLPSPKGATESTARSPKADACANVVALPPLASSVKAQSPSDVAASIATTSPASSSSASAVAAPRPSASPPRTLLSKSSRSHTGRFEDGSGPTTGQKRTLRQRELARRTSSTRVLDEMPTYTGVGRRPSAVGGALVVKRGGDKRPLQLEKISASATPSTNLLQLQLQSRQSNAQLPETGISNLGEAEHHEVKCAAEATGVTESDDTTPDDTIHVGAENRPATPPAAPKLETAAGGVEASNITTTSGPSASDSAKCVATRLGADAQETMPSGVVDVGQTNSAIDSQAALALGAQKLRANQDEVTANGTPNTNDAAEIIDDTGIQATLAVDQEAKATVQCEETGVTSVKPATVTANNEGISQGNTSTQQGTTTGSAVSVEDQAGTNGAANTNGVAGARGANDPTDANGETNAQVALPIAQEAETTAQNAGPDVTSVKSGTTTASDDEHARANTSTPQAATTRGVVCEEDEAAETIQCAVRTHRAKSARAKAKAKAKAHAVSRRKAATAIQKAIRGHSARSGFKVKQQLMQRERQAWRTEEEAATRVQSAVRARRARQQHQRKREAAKKLQAAMRGRAVRRRQAGLRAKAKKEQLAASSGPVNDTSADGNQSQVAAETENLALSTTAGADGHSRAESLQLSEDGLSAGDLSESDNYPPLEPGMRVGAFQDPEDEDSAFRPGTLVRLLEGGERAEVAFDAGDTLVMDAYDVMPLDMDGSGDAENEADLEKENLASTVQIGNIPSTLNNSLARTETETTFGETFDEDSTFYTDDETLDLLEGDRVVVWEHDDADADDPFRKATVVQVLKGGLEVEVKYEDDETVEVVSEARIASLEQPAEEGEEDGDRDYVAFDIDKV